MLFLHSFFSSSFCFVLYFTAALPVLAKYVLQLAASFSGSAQLLSAPPQPSRFRPVSSRPELERRQPEPICQQHKRCLELSLIFFCKRVSNQASMLHHSGRDVDKRSLSSVMRSRDQPCPRPSRMCCAPSLPPSEVLVFDMRL